LMDLTALRRAEEMIEMDERRDTACLPGQRGGRIDGSHTPCLSIRPQGGL
jgi:hypothetical protein